MTLAAESRLLYLSAAEVVALSRQIDPLAVVTDAFLAVRAGRAAIAPEAALRWQAPDGTAARSLVLPAWYADAYGCKVINACIGNPDRGLPRAHGFITLFDPATAVPVCVMEGGHISATRTAAVSVAAVRAIRDLTALQRLSVLGCGRQARTHLELLATRSSPRSVTLHDADPARARALAEDVQRLMPDAAVRCADTPESAVRAADVVIAVTTTTTPYVALDWLDKGAVFVNVSLDDATEDLLLGCEHLFVDDWELVSEDDTRLLGRLATAGRVSGPGRPVEPGVRRVDADLATLLAGEYRADIADTDRVVVNPFGMGVHDIAMAATVHAAALESKVGTWLPR